MRKQIVGCLVAAASVIGVSGVADALAGGSFDDFKRIRAEDKNDADGVAEFRYSAITGLGGANSFVVFQGDDKDLAFQIGGADVAGRFMAVQTIEDWQAKDR